jgi:hypothetical protein
MIPIPFDEAVAQLLLRYAKLIVARGYVHNSLGNLAIRVPTLTFPTAWPTPSMPRCRWRR